MNKPAILGGKPKFSVPIQFIKTPVHRYKEFLKNEFDGILENGMLTNNATVKKLEHEVKGFLGSEDVVAMSTCTAGLMLTANLLGLKGQEVILPSFTFCATGLSLSWNGCRLKFVDIDEDTFNISVDSIQEAISPKTKAILGVHIFGNPCSIKALAEIANDHKIKLFFDAASAFGSAYDGKRIGNFGDAEIFSCSPTKIFSTMEGGIVSSNDRKLIEKLKLCRNYGILGNYDIEHQGLSARLPETSAALGLAYMKDMEEYIKNRQKYTNQYINRLKGIKGISFQKVQEKSSSSCKDFALVIDSGEFGMSRDAFVKALSMENIPTKKYFYPPLHQTKIYKEHASERLPITEKVASNIVCLPFYNIMEEGLIDDICDAVVRIHSNSQEVSNAARQFFP